MGRDHALPEVGATLEVFEVARADPLSHEPPEHQVGAVRRREVHRVNLGAVCAQQRRHAARVEPARHVGHHAPLVAKPHANRIVEGGEQTRAEGVGRALDWRDVVPAKVRFGACPVAVDAQPLARFDRLDPCIGRPRPLRLAERGELRLCREVGLFAERRQQFQHHAQRGGEHQHAIIDGPVQRPQCELVGGQPDATRRHIDVREAEGATCGTQRRVVRRDSVAVQRHHVGAWLRPAADQRLAGEQRDALARVQQRVAIEKAEVEVRECMPIAAQHGRAVFGDAAQALGQHRGKPRRQRHTRLQLDRAREQRHGAKLPLPCADATESRAINGESSHNGTWRDRCVEDRSAGKTPPANGCIRGARLFHEVRSRRQHDW
jgi:hypothetical protein